MRIRLIGPEIAPFQNYRRRWRPVRRSAPPGQRARDSRGTSAAAESSFRTPRKDIDSGSPNGSRPPRVAMRFPRATKPSWSGVYTRAAECIGFSGQRVARTDQRGSPKQDASRNQCDQPSGCDRMRSMVSRSSQHSPRGWWRNASTGTIDFSAGRRELNSKKEICSIGSRCSKELSVTSRLDQFD
jgi:hypothetical protein